MRSSFYFVKSQNDNLLSWKAVSLRKLRTTSRALVQFWSTPWANFTSTFVGIKVMYRKWIKVFSKIILQYWRQNLYREIQNFGQAKGFKILNTYGFKNPVSFIKKAWFSSRAIISFDNNLKHLSGNSRNSLTQGQSTFQAIYRLKSTFFDNKTDNKTSNWPFGLTLTFYTLFVSPFLSFLEQKLKWQR